MTPPTEQRERVSEDSPTLLPETDIRIRWIDDFIRDWQAEVFGRWLRERGL